MADNTPSLRRRAFLVAATLFCSAATAAVAQEDVALLGTWLLDEASLRTDVDAVMADEFKNLPAEAREQARAAMQAEVDRIIQTAAGTIQFRADGTATSSGAAGPAEWVWTATNGVLRLEKKEALVSDVPLLGTVVGDTLYLEPDVAGEPGLPLPLKRKR
jgi:hypothetical protein